MGEVRAGAPRHLWLVGIVALLFNAIGVFDFVMTLLKGAEYQAGAGMTPEQIAHMQSLPPWMMLDWAVGVFGAFAASLLLLARRALAAPVFVVSLVAFLVSVLYTYVLSDGGAVMGPQMAVVSALIATLLLAFAAYARHMAGRGVLR